VRGALAVGGLVMAVSGLGERAPVSITCAELSSLPQGSGVTTRRTPNVVSDAVHGMWRGGERGSGLCGAQTPASACSAWPQAPWAASARLRRGAWLGEGQIHPSHAKVGMVRGASLSGVLM